MFRKHLTRAPGLKPQNETFSLNQPWLLTLYGRFVVQLSFIKTIILQKIPQPDNSWRLVFSLFLHLLSWNKSKYKDEQSVGVFFLFLCIKSICNLWNLLTPENQSGIYTCIKNCSNLALKISSKKSSRDNFPIPHPYYLEFGIKIYFSPKSQTSLSNYSFHVVPKLCLDQYIH